MKKALVLFLSSLAGIPTAFVTIVFPVHLESLFAVHSDIRFFSIFFMYFVILALFISILWRPHYPNIFFTIPIIIPSLSYTLMFITEMSSSLSTEIIFKLLLPLSPIAYVLTLWLKRKSKNKNHLMTSEKIFVMAVFSFILLCLTLFLPKNHIVYSEKEMAAIGFGYPFSFFIQDFRTCCEQPSPHFPHNFNYIDYPIFEIPSSLDGTGLALSYLTIFFVIILFGYIFEKYHTKKHGKTTR